MYRREHRIQLSFADFFLRFGGKLSGHNRWVKLANLISLDELEDDYASQFCEGFGAAPSWRPSFLRSAINFSTRLGSPSTLANRDFSRCLIRSSFSLAGSAPAGPPTCPHSQTPAIAGAAPGASRAPDLLASPRPVGMSTALGGCRDDGCGRCQRFQSLLPPGEEGLPSAALPQSWPSRSRSTPQGRPSRQNSIPQPARTPRAPS